MRKSRLQALYHVLFVALLASAIASRRRAEQFDKIPLKELAAAYAEHLGQLFVQESDLAIKPPWLLLSLFGLSAESLARSESLSAVSIEAAERAAKREQVVVAAL